MKNRFVEMNTVKKQFPIGQSVKISRQIQDPRFAPIEPSTMPNRGIVAGYSFNKGAYWCGIKVSIYFPELDKNSDFAYTLLSF